MAVSAADEAGALAAAEAVGARLDALVTQGVLQGYASPARFLPSPATQRARLAALPDAATLRRGWPRRPKAGRCRRHASAPSSTRSQARAQGRRFDRKALDGTPLATAVDALLLRGDATRPWRALLNLQAGADGSTVDAARIRAAIAGIPGAQLVSIKPELDALYARYLRQAEWQAALGAAAVVALLRAGAAQRTPPGRGAAADRRRHASSCSPRWPRAARRSASCTSSACC